jgi:membrane fusion protein, multidrug efflux system
MIKKIVVIVVVLAGIGLLSFRISEALKNKEEASSPKMGGGRPAVVVRTANAETTAFEDAVELTGELRPQAQVAVAPKISGRLSQVFVDNGDYVQKDQILAQLDDQELQQQVGRARASLQVAEAGLKQDIANLNNARSQLTRYERLYASKLVSLQSLEDLRSRVLAGEAQQELAEAQINQARAALRELEIQLEQTRLYAPMSGFVGERNLHPGALVNPNSSIVSLFDLSRMKTVVAATEQQLRLLRVGLTTRVTVDAYPTETFTGSISRISPLLDPATRTAQIEIVIPNRESLLRGGMFVRAAVVISSRDSLAIPREALVIRENRNGVFLIDEGRALFQEIEIGVSQGGLVQVLNGLEPGQEIIASGAQFLSHGDAVRRPGEQPQRPGQAPGGQRSNRS